jgi:putative transposase
MAKRYVVELTDEERNQLLALLKKGKVAARTVRRAHILLQADAGERDVDIAATVPVGVATVERTRKRFVTAGLEAALPEQRRLGGQPTLRGKDEAFLLATACRAPPGGAGRGGRCSCEPIAWWKWGLSTPSLRIRSGAR